jgi:hypothetical protein
MTHTSPVYCTSHARPGRAPSWFISLSRDVHANRTRHPVDPKVLPSQFLTAGAVGTTFAMQRAWGDELTRKCASYVVELRASRRAED